MPNIHQYLNIFLPNIHQYLNKATTHIVLQYSPSSWRQWINGAKLEHKAMKNSRRKNFSEGICKLITGSDIVCLDHLGLNLLPNEVTIYFNMFCSFMKNRIGGDVHSCLIVAEQFHRTSRRKSKICQQVFKPHHLT